MIDKTKGLDVPHLVGEDRCDASSEAALASIRALRALLVDDGYRYSQ